MSALDDLWYGRGAIARAARAALTPLSWMYGSGVAVRSRRFGRDDGSVHPSALPVLSIGNITAGGTGKTPLAAWAASALKAKGAAPAIVMRGYGGDEPIVHARLNPGVSVIVDADRVRGVERAKADGADCAILDDGFQHRRIARVADWVLVGADRWRDNLRLLPAGPLREPVNALARASIAVVTRKNASLEMANGIASRLRAGFPRLRTALCHFAPGPLEDIRTGTRLPADWLCGRNVVAAAAIADPAAFFTQLRGLGAALDERPFRDHHAFSVAEVASLARAAGRAEALLCTLKDAVKLAPCWPDGAVPLLYVSQIVVIERGASVLDDELEAVLATRQAASSTAG